jgi:hypothetical protein
VGFTAVLDMAVYRKSLPYAGWNHPAGRGKVSCILNFTLEKESLLLIG